MSRRYVTVPIDRAIIDALGADRNGKPVDLDALAREIMQEEYDEVPPLDADVAIVSEIGESVVRVAYVWGSP